MKREELKTGRWVKYYPAFGKPERGRIKSWNDEYAFVVYRCDNRWHDYESYTGCATRIEDLVVSD